MMSHPKANRMEVMRVVQPSKFIKVWMVTFVDKMDTDNVKWLYFV